MSTVMRAGSVALAAARLAVGATALAAPTWLAGTWVGNSEGPAASVLGRALGARDLALGAGALLAARGGDRAELRRWVALGAAADGVDAAVTLRSWSALPSGYRLVVLGMAGGGAVAGAMAAAALRDN